MNDIEIGRGIDLIKKREGLYKMVYEKNSIHGCEGRGTLLLIKKSTEPMYDFFPFLCEVAAPENYIILRRNFCGGV